MPDSQGRRRGRNKPARGRRRAGSAVSGSSQGPSAPSKPGWFPKIRRRTRRRIRRWVFLGAAGLIAFLIILSFSLSSFPGAGGGSVGAGGRSSPDADVGTSVAVTGASHVPTGQPVVYSTTPPTSGDHWGTPAGCGVYDVAVADEMIVHNMEHGHVIISYNLSDPDEVTRLEQLAEDLPDLEQWGIVRPYQKIDADTVVMTAWGVIDQIQGVDEVRIRRFYETYFKNRLSAETSSLGRAIPCSSIVQR